MNLIFFFNLNNIKKKIYLPPLQLAVDYFCNEIVELLLTIPNIDINKSNIL